MGSMRSNSRSGRMIASTIPGSPAPDPTSATVPDAGRRDPTAAESKMCRRQSRRTSRGPMSPRSSPSSASICPNSSAAARPRPKISREAVSVPAMMSGIGTDDDPAVRLGALRFAAETCFRHGVVNDLALEGVHRFHLDRLAAVLRPLDRLAGELGEGIAPLLPVPRDVEHQPGAFPGLGLHGEPSEVLECVEDLSLFSDEGTEPPLRVRLGDNRDRGAPTINVEVDVAIEVGDVEQFLEVVGGDVPLEFELLDLFGRGRVRHGIPNV